MSAHVTVVEDVVDRKWSYSQQYRQKLPFPLGGGGGGGTRIEKIVASLA
jgi:hypothetical protein